jgi:hypothetical protein
MSAPDPQPRDIAVEEESEEVERQLEEQSEAHDPGGGDAGGAGRTT